MNGEDLPNAVKISPPCCLVKLTTWIDGESADDVGGNTRDVGTGPARQIGIIDRPFKSLWMFAANRKIINHCHVSIGFVARGDFLILWTADGNATFDACANGAIFIHDIRTEIPFLSQYPLIRCRSR